jgi:hypothetical protein
MPNYWAFYSDISKARKLIGDSPQYDYRRMMATRSPLLQARIKRHCGIAANVSRNLANDHEYTSRSGEVL